MRQLTTRARAGLHKLGIDIVRYPAGTAWGASLERVLRQTDPDLLVDVGACYGAFSDTCRALGYRGRIVSFEPSSTQYDVLARRAQSDPLWSVHCLALGDEAGKADLHVAEAAVLSSLLPATAEGRRQLRTMRTVGVQRVAVARLEEALASLDADPQRVFLKIDTQGFDMRVLRGAVGILDRVVALQVELSLQPFYEGASDYLDVLAWLRDHEFEPVDIVPRAAQAGLLGEAECLLRRTSAVTARRSR